MLESVCGHFVHLVSVKNPRNKRDVGTQDLVQSAVYIIRPMADRLRDNSNSNSKFIHPQDRTPLTCLSNHVYVCLLFAVKLLHAAAVIASYPYTMLIGSVAD